MNSSNLTQLYHVKDSFISAKNKILEEWISQHSCSEIFEHHLIEPKWFKEHYASGVFDYFMGVVEGSVELGQCPIMKDFIVYLKNQEIRSDELFTLCTHFKRSVVNITYTLDSNTQELFEEISYLFDKNFAGVLTLYTDTIYQKEQEAIEANKAKEYFLSNMSHEIRTPLNAILGFVHLLKSESLGERIEKYLDIIAQSGENLLHVINDILDFSKLRSGEFVIDPHPFNIHTEITNTLELFVPSANVKSISIVYTINPNISHCIVADSFRIQQIVGNLLSNAIKFSPPECSIDVNVEVDVKNSTLLISVRDYGTGISVEDQKSIFNPFYQAAEGRKFGGSGSGLGLSICKQLAIQMGGEITLESNIGWGSLFIVTLAVELPPEEFCTAKAVESKDTLFFGNVLVAEDNEANQELIKIILERFGLKTKVVSNGQEAYQCVCTSTYDIIFMDEQMPIMDGYEAVAKIRDFEKKKRLSAVPIVALSANVIKGTRERALEWGYNAFVGKPFEIKDLVPILEKYLTKTVSLGTESPHNNQEYFEMERLKKALMLEDEQIFQLLELFHSKTSEALLELKKGIEIRDYECIGRIAHTIKGSSANFRFEEFSRLASLIEESAEDNEENFDFEEEYRALEKEYRLLLRQEKLYSSR